MPSADPAIRPTTGDSAWFTRARFGLFLHWGLYAVPARHEWVQQYEKIPHEDYRKRWFEYFEADLFDPDQWADLAKRAGMGYAVLTAKHHDGYCLWDTAHTDFKSTTTGPRRDLVAGFQNAFHAAGLRSGLYYSLLDWSHPHFTIDRLHPLRDDPRREDLNRGRDMAVFRQYLRDQVRELLTSGRPTDLLWLDYSYPTDPAKGPGKGRDEWGSDELVDLVRSLAPKILLNDRLDLRHRADAWDFTTPEQYMIQEAPRVDGRRVVFESCQTFSGSWGYFRDETSWKSLEQLLLMLAHTVSLGGNFLLNVGPDARGRFDPRAVERLEGIATWMELHRRSIIGCGEAPPDLTVPPDCRLTWNPETGRAYLHLLAWPYRRLILEGPAWHQRLRHAQLLNDGSELPVFRPVKPAVDFPTIAPVREGTVELTLPVAKPPVAMPVIELFLADP